MKYHLIGIGGVGMQGLAKLLIESGHEITGCDLRECQVSGVKCQVGHSEKHISKDLDGMIVTVAALHESSPAKGEIVKAKQLKVPIIKRSQMIGKLMSQPRITGIAVTGMHGKTTTSSMIATILEKAGYDPTILIGGEVRNIGTSAKLGKSDYFVAEACEYEKQMLDFRPKIAVITNLEEEHLDTYPAGMKDIKQAFKKFIKKLPKDGLLVVWQEDKNLMSLIKAVKCKVKKVSINNPWPGLKLRIPGRHILLDATFAARVCHELGVGSKTIQSALNEFIGAGRRFEVKGIKNGVTIVDDYGHHPTEIKAVIEAAREYLHKFPISNFQFPNPSRQDRAEVLTDKSKISNNKFQKSNHQKPLSRQKANKLHPKKLIVVFQPHQYLRTKRLFKDFVQSFDKVDKLIITDIYLIAGREPKEARADFSQELVKEIKKRGVDVQYISGYDNILREIKNINKSGDVILTLGATDIYKVGEEFLKNE